jgi:hypothetical protein
MAHFFKLAQDTDYYQGDALYSAENIVVVKKQTNLAMGVTYSDGASVRIGVTPTLTASPSNATLMSFSKALVTPAVKSSQEHWAKGPVVQDVSFPDGYTFTGLTSS